jgi:hypothetical protein
MLGQKLDHTPQIKEAHTICLHNVHLHRFVHRWFRQATKNSLYI